MENQSQKSLKQLLSDFETAMMVTHSRQKLHARPMHIAKIEDSEIYFVTGLNSPKTAEIEKNQETTLIFQKAKVFVTVEGEAKILTDSSQINELWSEAWRVWFPKGKEDPNICLIVISARQAEYWDNSGLEGLKYLFSAASAYLTGKTPEVDSEQHGKLRL